MSDASGEVAREEVADATDDGTVVGTGEVVRDAVRDDGTDGGFDLSATSAARRARISSNRDCVDVVGVFDAVAPVTTLDDGVLAVKVPPTVVAAVVVPF